MDHGTRKYYEERDRSARRVSLTALGLSLLFLGGLLLCLLPPLQRRIVEIPIMRFGFHGPTRLVNLLQVEAMPGRRRHLTDVGNIETEGGVRGGGGGTPEPAGPATRSPGRPLPGEGLGDAEQDLVRRALSGQSGLPVFQSEDLILEHLERPIYPEDAQDRGIEGRVAVMAHIDTLGNVVEAAIMESSGSSQLDEAGRTAVLQCRFRPYREGNGPVTEVFAVFRFAFRIYY
jgi:TonB family protein